MWVAAKFILKASLVVGFIALAIVFYPVTLSIIGLVIIYRIFKRIKTKRLIKNWYNQDYKKVSSTDIDDAFVKLVENISEYDANDEEYKFNVYNLPYGRINAFLNYFGNSINNDEIYYFSAIKSMDDNEIREYGTAITRKGIYISKQYITNDEETKYVVDNKFIPYEGLYCCNNDDEKFIFTKVNITKKTFVEEEVNNKITTISTDRIMQLCNKIIELKIPHTYVINSNIDNKKIDDVVEESERNMEEKSYLKNIENIGSIAGVMGAQEKIYNAYDENKNYMNGARGGGYAAEYGNNTADRFLGKKVRNEAQNLDSNTGRQIKHGADRVVDGVKIQTKYYQSASESIGAAFEHKHSIYNENGQMMQIEVPRDQYQEALKLMKKRIDSGQVEGAKPGDNPSKYVTKGHYTYAQANNIAIAGTVDSLKVDIKNGAIVCSQAGGISAIIAFSIAVWKGYSIKDAAKVGITTGMKVLGKGTLVYALTMQLSRDKLVNPFAANILTSKGTLKSVEYISNPVFAASENLAAKISNSTIANSGVGQAVGLDSISGKQIISNGLTAAVIFGPDLCRSLTGRISGKQLFKNSAVGASGVGGSMVGQALIPIPVVGAVVGGMIGGFFAKTVLDEFIEDDAKLMFQILKEEFLDVVMVSDLSSDEFEKVVSLTISHPKISSLLMDMFASNEYRSFARNAIVTVTVTNVISERTTIKDENIYNGYELLLESA